MWINAKRLEGSLGSFWQNDELMLSVNCVTTNTHREILIQEFKTRRHRSQIKRFYYCCEATRAEKRIMQNWTELFVLKFKLYLKHNCLSFWEDSVSSRLHLACIRYLIYRIYPTLFGFVSLGFMKLNISLHDIDLEWTPNIWRKIFIFLQFHIHIHRKRKKKNFWNFIYFEFFMLSRAGGWWKGATWKMMKMLWEEFFCLLEKNFKQNCNLLICHERVSMMRYEALGRYSTFTFTQRETMWCRQRKCKENSSYAIWMMSTLCEQRKFARNSSLYLDQHDWTRNLAT